MFRSLARVSPLLLALALFAVPAAADVYYVTLTNGTVVETARQPQQASWDPNMVLLLTEVGNWVGFPKDQVKSVRAEDPTQGFGIRISDHAIALGRSPNDLPTEDDSTKSKADQLTDRYLEYMNRMLDLQEQRQSNSVQQFVDTENAGAGGGVPMGYVNNLAGAGFGAMGGNFVNTPSSTNVPVGGAVNGVVTGNEITPPQ